MASPDSKTILETAFELALRTRTRTLLAVAEKNIRGKWFESPPPDFKIILALSDSRAFERFSRKHFKVVRFPLSLLSRFAKIRNILIEALAEDYIADDEKIICVNGSIKNPEPFDSITLIDLSTQFQGISYFRKFAISKRISLRVVSSVIDIAVELGRYGREGKSVGTIFMIGDTKNLLPLSKQLIFNPFRGYPDSRKNIRDPRLKESICEFAKIDGAFILKGDGVVRSAGRLLHIPARSKVQIAEGLGSRHNAAAYITKKTDSIAVVVSESTGVVSVFIKGRIIFHLEPSAEEYALN